MASSAVEARISTRKSVRWRILGGWYQLFPKSVRIISHSGQSRDAAGVFFPNSADRCPAVERKTFSVISLFTRLAILGRIPDRR
jgi:hypothetical protein